MAGHSQFKNIMHRKGRQDAQKSKLFSKLAREITVAAKMGQPDPTMNARLRAAIISARQENMSKDSIERAVKKAIGGESENYDEIRYEGYGPGGVAVIVEALTDNRNRAASDIRSYFTKSGGNLGETGSVAFMFDRTGIIEYDAGVASDDAMLDAAIEAGADDVSSSENGHEIYASPETFREVARALEAKFGEARKAALTWKPQNTVPVDDETGEKLLKLIDLLERPRRRAERLRQFRGLGRAARQIGRLGVADHASPDAAKRNPGLSHPRHDSRIAQCCIRATTPATHSSRHRPRKRATQYSEASVIDPKGCGVLGPRFREDDGVDVARHDG